jgi:hypothetical protein
MSCWVVPSLAAEIWRVPLEELWRRIRDGHVPARVENGFTFVDVAPYGPRIEQPNRRPDQRPSTFAPVLAPLEPAPLSISGTMDPSSLDNGQDNAADDDELGPADENASLDLGDWRAARRRNARLRVPPLRWRLSA